MNLAYVFCSPPHGNSASREGLDALLAATAFCAGQDIAVYFLDDGVLNLLRGQQPEIILQKDFISAFKLLDLYDIENRFVCRESLQQYGLDAQDLIIGCQKIDRTLLMQQLKQVKKVLTF